MNLKRIGIIIGFLTYGILLLPMYETKIGGMESGNLIVRGYNLAEFSVWGCLILVLPILLLGIACCNIGNRWKNLMLMCFYMLNIVSLYFANTFAYEWVHSIAGGYVQFNLYMPVYALLMLGAVVCLFVYFNKGEEAVYEKN